MKNHELNANGKNINGKNKGSYLLLGMGIGAVFSLLFAPRAGQEIRHAIREKTDKSRRALERQSQRLSEVARSVMDKSKHYIQSGRETVSGAVDASKQAYRNTREGTRNEFNDRPRD